MTTQRRITATAVAGLAIAGLLVGCTGGADPTPEPSGDISGNLIVGGWGGRFTEATVEHLTDPFTADTGVTVQFVDAPGEQVARLGAMTSANRIEWDAIDALDPSGAFVAYHEGYAAAMPDDVRQRLEQYVPAEKLTEYGMTYSANAFVTGCNLDAAAACPTNPQEFFDLANFPGDRAMIDRPLIALTYALAADGVAPQDMFPMDLDRAFAKLATIKDSVKVWYSAGNQMEQIMIDEQVVMGLLWSGRSYNVLDQGTNLSISWDGAVYEPGQWFVVNGAPNEAAAWALIESIAANAEGQAKWATEMSYGISNLDAFNHMESAVAERLPDWPANFEQSIVPDFMWYAANRADIEKLWLEFISG
ncbi:MAG TPA: extracellular solute-binding protein [Terrimesophilobacter sp.]|nr:extracellular solute-binding protein [Terrimesophilobacter sp.]HRP99190.1 extracellular solute-binding protein [Terrimesophilobacter sp.]